MKTETLTPKSAPDAIAQSGPTAAAASPGSVRGLYQSLSIAEGRVIKLHCQGLSLKEIGGELFISPKTVAVHMHTIRRKMKECGVKFAPRIISAH